MQDFGKIHRGVAHFGVWADETADALAVLADAVQRSQDQDLRHDQATADALAYLVEQAGGEKGVAAFKKAIDLPHPVTRRQALAEAYKRLCRAAEGRQIVDL